MSLNTSITEKMPNFIQKDLGLTGQEIQTQQYLMKNAIIEKCFDQSLVSVYPSSLNLSEVSTSYIQQSTLDNKESNLNQVYALYLKQVDANAQQIMQKQEFARLQNSLKGLNKEQITRLFNDLKKTLENKEFVGPPFVKIDFDYIENIINQYKAPAVVAEKDIEKKGCCTLL
jgi:hypothetical protein